MTALLNEPLDDAEAEESAERRAGHCAGTCPSVAWESQKQITAIFGSLIFVLDPSGAASHN